MAISSWHFWHMLLGCLVKKGLQNGGSRAPRDPPPLATPLYHSHDRKSHVKSIHFFFSEFNDKIVLARVVEGEFESCHLINVQYNCIMRFWSVCVGVTRYPLKPDNFILCFLVRVLVIST